MEYNDNENKAFQKSEKVTISGFQEEQDDQRRTIIGLANEIDYKNHKLLELELKYNDTNTLFRKVVVGLMETINSKDDCLSKMEQKCHQATVDNKRLVNEKDALINQYSREMSRILFINQNLENVVERQKKEVYQLANLLEEKDLAQIVLKDEIEKLKQKSKDESAVVSLSCSNSDVEVKDLAKEMEEKEEEVWSLQTLNHILAARDFQSNKEVQECRKELVDGLQGVLNKRTKFGIKRMGEIDSNPFLELCYQRIPGDDWQGLAAKICSCWQEHVQDPLWHPFKIEASDGVVTREILDEDDEKLKALRTEFGEAAFKAVARALLELNEYNPSGRYPVPEIWNLKENRKAGLKEVILYVVNQLKAHKKPRKRMQIH